MQEVQSESQFIWKFLWHVLLTPVTFVSILFGKKEWSDLFLPFKDIVTFIFEPKFTIGILILNVIVFGAQLFLFDENMIEVLINFPSDLVSSRAYTIITSGFLHGDIYHLLWNMLALFIFGRVIERKLGSFKTGMVYFGALILSGIFNSLAYLFIVGGDPAGLGASGAIMGLVSTAMLLDPFYFTYELIVPLPIMVVGWIALYGDVIGILSPTKDNIGHLAHLGGYLSIGLIMYFLEKEDNSALKKGLIINVVSFVVVVAAVTYFNL